MGLLDGMGVAYLVDGEGIQTNDFESLVDGGTYTLGPPLPPPIPQTLGVSKLIHKAVGGTDTHSSQYFLLVHHSSSCRDYKQICRPFLSTPICPS
jgi:hypothetical protein